MSTPDHLSVNIDVSNPLFEQFERDLGLESADSRMRLRPDVGTGDDAVFRRFPDGIEVYHFGRTRFAKPLVIRTINDAGSDWHLIHMNLGSAKQRKVVDGQPIEFHKLLPIGLLIYGPGLDITTQIPPGVEAEVASIRFNRASLAAYFDDEHRLFDTRKNLICEDLDHELQQTLDRVLTSLDDPLRCHANVLAFMSQLFTKVGAHENSDAGRLRESDIDGLFRAAAHLRDPTAAAVPSVDELAAIANMSSTKFKSSFRQLFGSAPKQYHNKIRMEFARDALESGERTPSEISYLLGYSHPSNFTVAYKKYFGELPSTSANK